jgi:hypothetical protein
MNEEVSVLSKYRDVRYTRTCVHVMSPFLEVRTRAIKLTLGVALKEVSLYCS